jgi:hypothetical protein
MGLYGLVGEPGADGVTVLIDGMEICGSTGNASLPHSGVGMQLSNYPVGLKNGSLPHGSVTVKDLFVHNCSASGLDIENWVPHRIALSLDNLTIGRGVASHAQYWPGHPASGPPVPIALSPYDDAHLVGGVSFGPRPATIDMRDFASSPPRPRPWLSVTVQESPVGMTDVVGAATVLTDDPSMCEVAVGRGGGANVTVNVTCQAT